MSSRLSGTLAILVMDRFDHNYMTLALALARKPPFGANFARMSLFVGD